MDTDWCLACGRRVDTAESEPYCSTLCKALEDVTEDDDRVIYHTVHHVSPQSRWIGRGTEGIHEWASHVPPGPPPPSPPPPATSSSASSSVSPSPPPTLAPPSPTFKPKRPRLMLDSQRPMRPTLCMSTPQPAQVANSRPITTPRQHISHFSSDRSTATTKTLTDSSIATPISAVPASASVFGSLANHVRTWVAPPQPHQRPSTPSSNTPTKPKHPSPHSNHFTVHVQMQQPQRRRIAPSAVPFSPFPTVLRPSSSFDDDDLSSVSDECIYDEKKQLSPFSVKHTTPLVINPPRGRHTGPSCPRDEHPAYRSRGRKPSRALA